ncbi:MAG: hypothetical protein WC612_03750 [Bdellovibrionales bacterium]|jgi:hypothetical protein
MSGYDFVKSAQLTSSLQHIEAIHSEFLKVFDYPDAEDSENWVDIVTRIYEVGGDASAFKAATYALERAKPNTPFAQAAGKKFDFFAERYFDKYPKKAREAVRLVFLTGLSSGNDESELTRRSRAKFINFNDRHFVCRPPFPAMPAPEKPKKDGFSLAHLFKGIKRNLTIGS